jgi:glycosyltransferase involved in cell wall biosynthesis
MTAHAFLKPQLASLVAGNWEVHLACSPDSGFQELSELPGINLHSIPMERNPSPVKDLVSLYRWSKLVRRIKPDIIVGSTPKAGLLSMLSGKWNNIPARIYHARGFRAQGLTGIKEKVALLAERRTVKAATRVLCDSVSLSNALVTAGCLDESARIVLGAGSCSGVDTRYFRPPSVGERKVARGMLEIPDTEFVVGFVGRVTEDKGIRELVRAVVDVNKTHSQVKLILVGPDEGGLQHPANLPAGNPIKYLGPTSDVRSVYWACDVFALPSYREGFPIAPLEAQSCGLPLITTTATGCIDSQPPANSQLTVAPKDPDAIATVITFLFTEPESRTNMGGQARDWVVENFTSSDVIQRHIEFLKRQVVK